jgi:hypothetical protein
MRIPLKDPTLPDCGQFGAQELSHVVFGDFINNKNFVGEHIFFQVKREIIS